MFMADIERFYVLILVVVLAIGILIVEVVGKQPTHVTREQQEISSVDIQKLSGNNYVVQTDKDVTWCVKENDTMKLVTRPKKYVNIIKDNKNTVHTFRGVQHYEIMKFIHVKDNINVYELHTDKPVQYQASSKDVTENREKAVEEQVEFSK